MGGASVVSALVFAVYIEPESNMQTPTYTAIVQRKIDGA
jgi:hypothetical protein